MGLGSIKRSDSRPPTSDTAATQAAKQAPPPAAAQSSKLQAPGTAVAPVDRYGAAQEAGSSSWKGSSLDTPDLLRRTSRRSGDDNRGAALTDSGIPGAGRMNAAPETAAAEPGAAGSPQAEGAEPPAAAPKSYAGLPPGEKAKQLAEDLRNPEVREGALAELKSMKPGELGKTLSAADPQARADLFNQVAPGMKPEDLGKTLRAADDKTRADLFNQLVTESGGTLTPQMTGALDSLATTGGRKALGSLFAETFKTGDTSGGQDVLAKYMGERPEHSATALGSLDAQQGAEFMKNVYGPNGNPGTRKQIDNIFKNHTDQVAPLLGHAASRVDKGTLGQMVSGMDPEALGKTVRNMKDEERVNLFNGLAKAGNKDATDKLYSGLDKLPPGERLAALGPVMDAGKGEAEFNGRSLVAGYIASGGAEKAAQRAKEMLNAGWGVAGTPASTTTPLESLSPKRASLNDLITNELPGLRNELGKLDAKPDPDKVDRVADACTAAVAIGGFGGPIAFNRLTETLKDANLNPAEMAAVLQRVKETGGRWEGAIYKADKEDLKAFSSLVAEKGGPEAKAIALNMLAKEVDQTGDNNRADILKNGIIEIARSGAGDVLTTPQGREAVRKGIYELLDEDDSPPKAGDLGRMVEGLPPDRMALMDSAIKDGFNDFVYKKSEGSVVIDILKGVDINGEIKAQTPEKSIQGTDEDGKPHEVPAPVQASGRIKFEINPGKILEADSHREAQAAVYEFDKYLADQRGRFGSGADRDNRSAYVYEQTLDGWQQTDVMLRRNGQLEVPNQS